MINYEQYSKFYRYFEQDLKNEAIDMLQQEIDINDECDIGDNIKSTLLVAISLAGYSRLEWISLLIEQGANVNLIDCGGFPAIDYVINDYKEEYQKCFKLLMNHGADVHNVINKIIQYEKIDWLFEFYPQIDWKKVNVDSFVINEIKERYDNWLLKEKLEQEITFQASSKLIKI